MNIARTTTQRLLENNSLKILLNRSPISRNYAFKSDLKIKWVHPGRIPSYKAEKSGDLERFQGLDKKRIISEFQNSKELETADEVVRKLFTLEYSPQKEAQRLFVEDTVKRVQRHDYDFGTAEVQIAKWTGVIRAGQAIMEKYPRNTVFKVALKELIDKRKKLLKRMRKWDYKRFEWILEKLNIEYKPEPLGYERVTRRGSLIKLTDTYCDKIREERLAAYKLQLEAEQEGFLEESIRSLEFIREEQKDCGVEVTVTQEEIDGFKKQLAELKQKKSNVVEE